MSYKVPAKNDKSSLTTAHAGDRRPNHPWDEIEAVYVQGEGLNNPGRAGMMDLTHAWPTQMTLARRYGLRKEQVSKRFARIGPDGQTVHQRRDAFKLVYKRQLDDNILRALVEREIRFRLATLALAELSLRHIAHLLSQPQTPDTLVKLMTAAKRAQEIGMVALDRPATGPEGGASLGNDDWSLMREIRRGARTITAPCPELPGLDR